MLTGWVCRCLTLRPGGRRCSGADLSAKHLLSADPASLLVRGCEPRGNNLLGELHVPHADQVLMETFIPHEAAPMVWSIRDARKQTGGRLRHHLMVLVNHTVSIHVSDGAQHVSKRIFSGIHLGFGPLASFRCISLKETRLHFAWIRLFLRLKCVLKFQIILILSLGHLLLSF